MLKIQMDAAAERRQEMQKLGGQVAQCSSSIKRLEVHVTQSFKGVENALNNLKLMMSTQYSLHDPLPEITKYVQTG